MTTKEIHEWVGEGIKVAKKEGLSLRSGLERAKPQPSRKYPDGPSEADMQFALTLLASAASKSERKKVEDTHDPMIAECKQLNADALAQVLLETGATINAAEYRHWRPTVRNMGAIEGVSRVHATVLATDGNLGLFTDESGHFFGHVQCFSGDVRTLFSINLQGEIQENSGGRPAAPRGPRKKRKSKSDLRADELLKELGLE